MRATRVQPDSRRDAATTGALTVAFVADRGDAGTRIDLVVARHLPPPAVRSRTQAQRLLTEGAVTINGLVVRRASARLAAGDAVGVTLPGESRRAVLAPQPGALDILFEDDWLLVVNKPPGLVVHPSYKHADGTLLNALLWHVQRSEPRSEVPHLVSRIDKGTSGVVVAAKTGAGHAALARVLRGPDAEKVYLAVTCGGPRKGTGTIRYALARDPGDRRRMLVADERGRESVTRFERLAFSVGTRRGLSLLRCRLVTGRTHQIRVHLSASGWPLVGDPVYGPTECARVRDHHLAEAVRRFPRQALHAWRLGFRHPFTDQPVALVANLPDDLQTLLQVAGLDHGLGVR